MSDRSRSLSPAPRPKPVRGRGRVARRDSYSEPSRSPTPRSTSTHSRGSGGGKRATPLSSDPLPRSRSLSPPSPVRSRDSGSAGRYRASRSPVRSPVRSWRSRSRSRSRSPRARSLSGRRASRSPPRRATRTPLRRGHFGGGHDDADVTVYVGNLPDGEDGPALEDRVRNLFEEWGTVSRVRMILDRETSRPRGFSFVTFDHAADAAAAAREANTVDLQGSRLRCKLAHSRPTAARSYRDGSMDKGPRGSPYRGHGRSPSPGYNGYRSPRRPQRSRSPARGSRYTPSRSQSRSPVSPAPQGRSPHPADLRKGSKRGEYSPRGTSPGGRSPVSPRGRKASRSRSESPIARKRRRGGESPKAASPGGGSAAKELQALRAENEGMEAELKRTRASLAKQAEVIDQIKTHAQSQRVKMKALIQRSQQRGQYMLMMTAAAQKVAQCKVRVTSAQTALNSALTDLSTVADTVQQYATEEEEQRAEEQRKKQAEAAQAAAGAGAGVGRVPAARTGPRVADLRSEGEGAASNGAPAHHSTMTAPAGSGFSLKPFKISLAD